MIRELDKGKKNYTFSLTFESVVTKLHIDMILEIRQAHGTECHKNLGRRCIIGLVVNGV